MVKVSVVIPCYNVEQYIHECMESVLSQTLYDMEVICIDDGSTDGTLSILGDYGAKTDKIRIIKQQNLGSGIARNNGIEAATGEYIAFMDADDFYPSADTLEKVYSAAKRNGAAICGGSLCTYRNGAYTKEGFKKGYTFLTEGWVDKKDFPTMSGYWRFIYNAAFIKGRQIFFPDYLRCQDPPFFLTAIAGAGRVYCLKDITYVYRKEHKQAPFTQKKAIDYAKGMRDSLMISKRDGLSAAYQQILFEMHGKSTALMYLFGRDNHEMREVIHQINEVIGDENGSDGICPMLKEGDEIAKYVRDVADEKQELLQDLRNEKRVLIYGAGTVGKRVYALLKKNHIAVESFVVTSMKQNALFQDGLQVRCIDDYINIKDECNIVIATFPCLQKEIEGILLDKGFMKVFPLPLEKFYLFEEDITY